MLTRSRIVFTLAGVWVSLGADYRTENFIVHAPSPRIARQIGEAAEKIRREMAIRWLGQAMPRWGQRCPITVKVSMGGPGGATSFVFDQGQILRQNMEIEGPLDRLLASVLPHEITHTVFAYYFREPVPRWADEGGAVLSEDKRERTRHDQLLRQMLNEDRGIPLGRLFSMSEYPQGIMSLYAQGYSVTSFLVGQRGRKTFLAFVAMGMKKGWDRALGTYYPYKNAEKLEQAWRAHLIKTKKDAERLAAIMEEAHKADSVSR